MSNLNFPLLGDGYGRYKIYLIGNSGTGKTTLGTYLSARLGPPHISLDELAWKPDWQQTTKNELKERVEACMAQNTEGWIIDGNYTRMLGTLISDNATDIIWLDPPLYYYLPRLLWRTLMRLLGLRSPCAEGCREKWSEVFSTRGIVWWCITNHGAARTTYREWLARMGVDVGGKMRRLDESRGELARWKDEVNDYIRRIYS